MCDLLIVWWGSHQDDMKLTLAIVYSCGVGGIALKIMSNLNLKFMLCWVLTIFAVLKMHKLEIQEIAKLDEFIFLAWQLESVTVTGLMMRAVSVALVLFLDLLSGRIRLSITVRYLYLCCSSWRRGEQFMQTSKG